MGLLDLNNSSEDLPIVAIVVESGSRQMIGEVLAVELGPVRLTNPLAYMETRDGPAMAPVTTQMVCEELLVNASSMIVVPSDTELYRAYRHHAAAVADSVRAKLAGLVAAREMPQEPLIRR